MTTTSGILPSAAFVCLFVLGLIWQLKEEWSLNPQYFYGWGVPILGIILAGQRWKDRPEADSSTLTIGMMLAALACLLLWLPLRMLREANMDWRLVQWLIAIGGVTFILGSLYWMGGRSWLWHFLFPVVFLFVAVPWPTRLENWVVQSSTGLVVRGAVEALRWMGYAAWSSGNVIQLPGVSVGVDEACSGLRSFQGSIMCALFLGELKRLSGRGRSILLLIGALVALSLNFLRTVVLTTVAAKSGILAVDVWHDGTGMGTLLAAFGALWMFSRLLDDHRTDTTPHSVSFQAIPSRVTIACAAWLILVESATALWFRVHEGGRSETLWTFAASNATEMRKEGISPRVQSILRFNEGAAFRRSLADGTEWWIYSIEWARDGGGAPLARFHSPEVCLPAAGFILVDRGPVFYPTGPDLPFRSYEFDWRGKPVYLFSSFHSSTRAGAIQSMNEFDLTWEKRIGLALAGRRPAEQKVFQVLISGSPSGHAAKEAFEEFAAQTLRRGT